MLCVKLWRLKRRFLSFPPLIPFYFPSLIRPKLFFASRQYSFIFSILPSSLFPSLLLKWMDLNSEGDMSLLLHSWSEAQHIFWLVISVTRLLFSFWKTQKFHIIDLERLLFEVKMCSDNPEFRILALSPPVSKKYSCMQIFKSLVARQSTRPTWCDVLTHGYDVQYIHVFPWRLKALHCRRPWLSTALNWSDDDVA